MQATTSPAPVQGGLFESYSPPVLEQFHEALADCLAEAAVDREQGVVRNVALLGPESKNGYRYTLEAMQQAVPLYEGRPVFVDHPVQEGDAETRRRGDAETEEQNMGEGIAASPRPRVPASSFHRSVRDYAGRVVSARFDGQRIRGDLQLAGPNAEWLLSLIESSPSDIGMSHVVLARWNEAGDAVEHIERVVSVDIVAFPATVQSFSECGSTAAALSSDRQPPEPAEATKTKRELCSRTPKELVEASRIPPAARTETLFRLLEKCPEPSELIALLERYWNEALKELGEQPQSVERAARDGTPAASARRAMLAAIRGR